MKFGKTLHDSIIQEWRFYAVNYKALKQTLKADDNEDEFFTLLEQSKFKLDKF
jgi:SPX domain protein involved in polyphosphate accumulation